MKGGGKGGGGASRRRGHNSRSQGGDPLHGGTAFNESAPSESCRTLPPSEYYGSMAAGSIVGATRGACPQQMPTNGAGGGGRERMGGRGGSGGFGGQSSRREPRSAAGRAEQWCRATLVPQYEGLAKVAECCVPGAGKEELPLITIADLSAPAGAPPQPTPTRSVWLVLTTNALTMYDSASRRARLATYSLRRGALVVPAVSAGTDGFGVLCGFLPEEILPPTARPPVLPLPDPSILLSTLGIFFTTVDKQLKWLTQLKQACDPKPPQPALPPALPPSVAPPMNPIPTGGLPLSALAGPVNTGLGGLAATRLSHDGVTPTTLIPPTLPIGLQGDNAAAAAAAAAAASLAAAAAAAAAKATADPASVGAALQTAGEAAQMAALAVLPNATTPARLAAGPAPVTADPRGIAPLGVPPVLPPPVAAALVPPVHVPPVVVPPVMPAVLPIGPGGVGLGVNSALLGGAGATPSRIRTGGSPGASLELLPSVQPVGVGVVGGAGGARVPGCSSLDMLPSASPPILTPSAVAGGMPRTGITPSLIPPTVPLMTPPDPRLRGAPMPAAIPSIPIPVPIPPLIPPVPVIPIGDGGVGLEADVDEDDPVVAEIAAVALEAVAAVVPDIID